jgi:hypothetical protein
MGSKPRAGGRYVRPIKSDGTEPAEDGGRGVFTLAANSLYYYVLGGGSASFVSGTLTGYTSGAIIDSATVQDTDHPELEITNIDGTAGNWISEDPATAFVGADGTGWSVTNGVLAVAGTGVGGARFNVAETAAARTRIAVDTGGTGGLFRMSAHGKG